LDAGAQAVGAGAGEVEVEVVLGLHLGGMALHGALPGGDEGGVGDVYENGGDVFGFGIGGEGVVEEGVDGVAVLWFKFGDAAVAGEACGIADEGAEAPVVGVLVLDEGGGEDDGGLVLADFGGEGEGVLRVELEVGVAVEVKEFDRGAEEVGGALCLGGADVGGAVGGGFAFGAEDEVALAAVGGFFSDERCDGEFEVVGVSGEGEEGWEGHGGDPLGCGR